MKRIAAVAAIISISCLVFAPTANALTIDLGPVHVKVLEDNDPDPHTVGVDATDDSLNVDVLTGNELISDPAVDVNLPVEVNVPGVVDIDLSTDAVVDTTPGPNDPLVHVCVNGTVESVLASVAADLHLDVIGSDDDCNSADGNGSGGGGNTSSDPLVHVCVNGNVESKLLSVALNLHLDVLGVDDKCGTGTGPTTPVDPTIPPISTNPGNTSVVSSSPSVDTPVVASDNSVSEGTPVSKKKGGPLAFTGSGWGILAIIGAGLGFAGLILLLLGALTKRV